jgi:hypothetical protein
MKMKNRLSISGRKIKGRSIEESIGFFPRRGGESLKDFIKRIKEVKKG